MRLDRVWEIARKDMQSVLKHKYVLYSLVGMPILLAVVLPLVSIYPLLQAPEGTVGVPHPIPGLPPKQGAILAMVYTSAIFLMLLPAMVPSVISSYSIVGEKTGKQLEPLLATPTTDSEILAGKSLGAFVPAMAATYASYAIFIGLVNFLIHPLFNRFLLLDLESLVIMFVAAPLVCSFSIAWCLLISSKVSDVRAAMQLGVVSMIPVMGLYGLILGGVGGFTVQILLVFSLVMAMASAALFQVNKATFKREEILTRWK